MKITTLLETMTTPASDPVGQQSQQAPKFGRDPNVLEDDEKLDETTTSGSITTGTPSDLGTQRRGQGSIFAGVRTSKKSPNSQSVKEDVTEGANAFMPGIENTPEYKRGFATGALPVPYPEGTQQYVNYYKGVMDKAGPEGVAEGSEQEKPIKKSDWFDPTDMRSPEKQKAAYLNHLAAKKKNKNIKEQGVAEGEKNPHTSALGKALYRALSKEKKASPQQVQRNKERWAQRQAAMVGDPAPQHYRDELAKDAAEYRKKQGVAEGYQDDSKEREENLRYARSRNPVADAIRKKLNPNQKPEKEQGVAEEKQRLDPKCWDGYKKQGTKMKGGVRVNNCVPVEESERVPEPEQQQIDANRRAAQQREREPAGSDKIDRMLAQQHAERQQYEKTGKFWLKTKDTQRHIEGPFVGKQAANQAALALLKRIPELKGNLLVTAWGPDEAPINEAEISEEVLANELYKDFQIFKRGTDKGISKKAKSRDLSDKPKDKDIIDKVTKESTEQDMRADELLSEGKPGLWANIHAKRERIKKGSGERMRKPGSKGAPSAQDFKDAAKTSKTEEAANPAQQAAIAIAMKKKGQKPKNEDFNPEYDDEAGMADNNLETLERAVDGIDELINTGDNLPEWCQEKIAVAKSMLVTVWDYMKSEEEINMAESQFDMIEEMVESWAQKHGVDSDVIWEDLALVEDDELVSLSEDWQKVNKKDKTPGMSRKAVKAYRRENPGSKLQTAVTTKPSKLKKGSKAAKRRKSFCARMKGMKKAHASAKTKRNPDSPINKALRRWNC